MHLICDNYGTHKTPAIKTWLAAHPRFHLHFTPTCSSWLNQVERWFAYLTDRLLRRGDHHSVQALEADIRAWVKAWNDNPQPVRLDQDRRRDPRTPRTTSPPNQRRRTLVSCAANSFDYVRTVGVMPRTGRPKAELIADR